MLLKKIFSLLVTLSLISTLLGRNTILEFKGAYFLPTNNSFKKIYKGNALYGPELTVQLCDENNWYAFASIDYLKTHGHSLGLHEPTTLRLLPLAFGLKYFIPTHECLDFYAGLGFETMNVRTKDNSINGIIKQSKWGFGFIAKAGAYYYLPCNFLIDLFIDYSYASVGKNAYHNQNGIVFKSTKATVSGAIFGAALGYKF